jgi:2-polyprenyl-6-methoxyphenol hydroxylase-like FAD-dependent oxidoreductase
MDSDYDVLVVGARVAGASLALLLGEKGHRVLLVDRDTFPSDTLSTHFVIASGMMALKRLGVLDDLHAAGFRRVVRSRTWVEDCLFEGPAGPAGASLLAPRRDALDSILIRHARERGGVEFHEQTFVEGLLEQDGRVVGATLRTRGDDRREVHARVVVGADGKYSKVADWVKAERYDTAPALRPAYYGYYHGLEPLPETALEMFFCDNRIGFVFPMRPGEDCLALELQPEEYEAFRANPREVFEERFRSLPGMSARMRDATLENSKLFGTRGIENYLRQPYGPGWALAGDAAYLKDPSNGSGIGDAVAQAFPLADALDETLRGADWEAIMSAYQRARDEAVTPMYHWTIASTQLHDVAPEAITWLRAALVTPHVARRLIYWLADAMPDELPPDVQQRVRATGPYFGIKPNTPVAVPASGEASDARS